jgi:hypothetical protein
MSAITDLISSGLTGPSACGHKGSDSSSQSVLSKAIDRQVYGLVNRGVNSVVGKYNRSVQTGLSRFVSKGSQQILDAIGVPKGSLPELGNISSVVVTTGVDAANQLFQGIISGQVTQGGVNSLSSYDVARAAGGTNLVAKQMLSLSGLAKLSQTAGIPGVIGGLLAGATIPGGESIVKNYAADLLEFAPKFKFMYVVQFNFNGAYQHNHQFKNDFAFLIKQFDRPNITVQHDDVNMYGYRTKVPKMTTYEPISIQIHDDNQNKSMNFFATYLRAISPIANIPVTDTGLAKSPTDFQNSSMSYDSTGKYGNLSTNSYAGSFGPLQIINDGTNSENAMTVLSSISLYHVYDYGQFMNVYNFSNPKIQQMSLDAVTSDENGVNALTLQIAYDSVYIESGRKASGFIPDTYEGIQLHTPLSGIPACGNQEVVDSSSGTHYSQAELLAQQDAGLFNTPSKSPTVGLLASAGGVVNNVANIASSSVSSVVSGVKSLFS